MMNNVNADPDVTALKKQMAKLEIALDQCRRQQDEAWRQNQTCKRESKAHLATIEALRAEADTHIDAMQRHEVTIKRVARERDEARRINHVLRTSVSEALEVIIRAPHVARAMLERTGQISEQK